MAQLNLEQFILSDDAFELKEQLKDVLYTTCNDLEGEVDTLIEGIYSNLDGNHENIYKVVEYARAHQGKSPNKFLWHLIDITGGHVLAVAFRE